MKSELLAISQQYLNSPYLLGPCGDGPKSEFDQNPICRWDVFDCVTYVNAVLARLLAESSGGIEEKYIKLNYQGSQVSYLHRLHFTCLDWNPVIEDLAIAKNITDKFLAPDGKTLIKIAETFIDKPSWYRHKKITDLKLISEVDEESKQRLLSRLQNLALKVSREKSSLPYLPLNALFDAQGEANIFLFNQFPDCSIMEIVRPNWDLTSSIGTHLNVSHLGFVFRIANKLVFRHASSKENKVVEVDLIGYLRDCKTISSIQGIHILGIS